MVKIKRSYDIDSELTFTRDDLLSRKMYGESLANLINNSTNESLVISINANWGEGKSYFLNMWQDYLRTERSTNVIYFDAFKNDFIDDPFVALLGELMKHYEGDKTALNKISDKGKNILKGLLPLGGKVLSRLALGGTIESVDEQIDKLIDGDISQFIGKTLEEYTSKDKSISLFKTTLEEIISEKGKLVFIIDELDRCRPDFAVRLLERIKHFFDIKGLYFVLGVNKGQLEKYIENIYGNINTSIYLQKFIDIETVLPKVTSDISSDNHYNIFINKCIVDNTTILDEKLDQRNKEYILNIFIEIAEGLKLSLRDIEKISNYLVLFYKSLPTKNHLNMPMLLFFIILVKVFDINLYKEFKEGNVSKDDILNILKIDQYKDSRYKEYFLKELNFIFDVNLSEKDNEEYENWLARYNMFDIKSLKGRRKVLNMHFSILDSFYYNLYLFGEKI